MFGLGYQELLIILVIVLVLFGANRLPELARSLGSSVKEFKKGVAAMNAQEWKKAERAFDRVTEAAPESGEGWRMLGASRLSQKDAKGAAKAYQKAVKINPEDVEAMVRFAVDTYGGLHVAVNNAGIGGAQAPTGEYGIDDWKRVIDINLNGVFYGLRYEIPAMLESGGGAIVNLASILGSVGFANSPGYVAAKHGVVGLTKTAAMEYATSGIRINSVAPGPIDTYGFAKTYYQGIGAESEKLPVPRFGTVEEVAAAVVFLASPASAWTTAATLDVSGGQQIWGDMWAIDPREI